jgi:hypothetical protein
MVRLGVVGLRLRLLVGRSAGRLGAGVLAAMTIVMVVGVVSSARGAVQRPLVRHPLASSAQRGIVAARGFSTAGLARFCGRLITHQGQAPPAHPIGASAGAMMACFGPESQSGGRASSTAPSAPSSGFSSNVNAANPEEDIAPSGTRAHGQSEVSTASTGRYVVEAWNDATAFFSPCPSPQFKEEGTGYGFSANGGASFIDQGGLPNNCASGFLYEGDPTVEAFRSGGVAYFYIGSLYVNGSTGASELALDACKVSGSGSSAALGCSQPIVVATGAGFDFLDKDFLTIDPKRGRLYMSYTRFGGSSGSNGQIELAACDIGTPTGGPGPAGGKAARPVCFPGASSAPYLVVAPGDPNCENEGAYPAVNVASGDVYVAWEFNWTTNLFNPSCFSVRVQDKTAYVPFSCLTLTSVSPCSTTPLTTAVNIVSMDGAFIPGYNRFPANDFPRIAVSKPANAVSIVWNDAGRNPLGDIFLLSYNLLTPTSRTFTPVQTAPIRLNTLSTGNLHFLPALRNADPSGKINVSFYQRPNPNTARTDTWAALTVNPRTTSTPPSNTRISTVSSDWNAVSSDIDPNFGDYTDNYLQATTSGPTYTSNLLYVAWSDGRIGVPQPFQAHGPG